MGELSDKAWFKSHINIWYKILVADTDADRKVQCLTALVRCVKNELETEEKSK